MGRYKKKKDKTIEKVASVQESLATQDTMLSEINAADFTVNIPDKIYQQCMWWVNKSDDEVSWFGNVTFDKETKVFTVVDVTLLEQTNTGTETEIEAAAITKAMFELKDSEGELKWWGHSHVNMGVFWSGQDMHTIRELGRQGWVVATVFNKKEETKSAFLQNINILGNNHDFFVDDIHTTITRYLDASDIEAWDAQYKEKVKEKPVVTQHYSNWGHNYYDSRTANEEFFNSLKENKQLVDATKNAFYGINDCINKFYTNESFWNAYGEVSDDLKGIEDAVEFDNVFVTSINATEEDFAASFDADIDNYHLQPVGKL